MTNVSVYQRNAINKNGHPWSVARLLLFLYMLFLFYVTYKPFNFHFSLPLLTRQLDYFINTIIQFKHTVLTTRSDIIANIIVFIPFGSFIYWVKWENSDFSKHIHWKKILFPVIGMTVLIELGQMFLNSRHPSFADIITNTLGGMVGYLIMDHFVRKYNEFTLFINHLIQEKWDVKLLIFMILLMFSYAWFPFSFGINVSQVMRHLSFLLNSPFTPGNLLNAIPYLVLYFYVQILILEIVEKYFNLNQIIVKICIAVIFVIAIGFVQFTGQSFVHGRSYNREDIFMAMGGMFAGVVSAYNLYTRNQLILDQNNKYLLLILKGTLLLNLLFVIGASVFPFHGEFSMVYLKSKFIIAFIPFNNYVNKSTLFLLMDLAKDLFKFVPLTIIISAIYDVKKQKEPRKIFIFLFFAVIMIEILQVFNKNFNPDISDIILGMISLYLGKRFWSLGKAALS